MPSLNALPVSDVCPRSEVRGARDCGANNLMVIVQTIDWRSIQLVELKGRRRRRWFEKREKVAVESRNLLASKFNSK